MLCRKYNSKCDPNRRGHSPASKPRILYSVDTGLLNCSLGSEMLGCLNGIRGSSYLGYIYETNFWELIRKTDKNSLHV